MTIRLSGALLKDGADNQDNMLEEDEEGNARVEEW